MAVTNTAATRVGGQLKRGIIFNISTAFGIGVPLAFTWWYTFHVARQKQRDQWYVEYAKKREEAEE